MAGVTERHLTLVRPVRSASTYARHFPALDGIRAVAVIAVLLYHFGAPYAAGGFLGVDLFFVLSGYLITCQLMTRWVNGPAITRHSFAVFWAARARRLFPPLAAVLLCTSATVAIADRAQLSLFRGDVAAAVTYESNWWYIFHRRSYFVAAGRPPMLQHLWSLAVEEQFYLVWPVVILLVTLVVRVRWARRGVLLLVAAGLLMTSAGLMGLGSMLGHVPESGDPSRWYFGTDSHSFGLLAGAVLAIVRDGDGLGSRSHAPTPRLGRRATITGFVAFAAILAMLSQTDEFATWLYRYGFLGFSVAATVLVAVATRRGVLERLLGTPVLAAIGRRSYSIYLWHWPIACMTRPGVDLHWPAWQVACLRVALTLTCTEASYRLIETPIRRHGWRLAWRRLIAWRVGTVSGPALIGGVIAAVAVAVCLPAGARAQQQPSYAAGVTYVHCTDDADGHPRPSADAPAGARCAPAPIPTTVAPTTAVQPPRPSSAAPSAARSPASSTSAAPPPTTTQSMPPAIGGAGSMRLAVYGDSVPLGAMPELAERFSTVTNHAVEGEQAWDLLPELIEDARAGRLDDQVVLLHTGDNGLIPQGDLDRALDALHGARRVIVATPRTPEQWEQANVRTIRTTVARHPGVVLLDWDATASASGGWFWKDGIHLTPTGGQAYARLVAAAALGR